MSAKRQSSNRDEDQGRRVVADNRKARFKFEVLEEVEAGLVLVGTEVKSLRDGKCSIEEAYGRIDGEEAFLVGAHIDEYRHGNRMNHEPTRKRKLLLRRRELAKLLDKVRQRGLTLVPLLLYFNERGYAKVRIGLCRGRKVGDKRQVEKKREAAREIRDY